MRKDILSVLVLTHNLTTFNSFIKPKISDNKLKLFEILNGDFISFLFQWYRTHNQQQSL